MTSVMKWAMPWANRCVTGTLPGTLALLVGIVLAGGPLANAQPLQERQVCAGQGNPDFEQRVKACSAIIEKSDEAPAERAFAYGNRAIAHQNNQDAEAAIRDYDLSLTLDSTSALAHRFKGVKLVLTKQYDLALAAFDEAIRLDPADAAAFNGRGLVYRAQKENEKALAAFSEAVRLNPDYAPFIGNRALVYRDMSDFARAIAEFDRAIAIAPNYFMTRYGRGVAYAGSKQYAKAIEDFDKAIELRPNFAATFLSRGAAYQAQGDLVRALADFDRTIQLNPKNSAAFVSRAFAYQSKADYDRAIADYDEAIRLDPKNASAVVRRGVAYREKGDVARAIADYGRAIEIDTGFALAYSNRCQDRIRLGHELKPALADCDEALRLTPGRSRTTSSRGYAHLKLGSVTAAIADFDTALSAEPNDAWSLYGRAIAKWQAKDVAGADADAAAAAKNRSNIIRMVRLYYGVTAERDFASRLAKARVRETPMIFAVAEGSSDACGPGCNVWIAADGSFDAGVENRLRAFLGELKGRKPPIFFNSSGGSMQQSYRIGKLLRTNKMTAGVARTMPEGCTAGPLACREKMQSGAPLKAAALQGAGAICHSACVYALMGGTVRQILIGASVGVHKAIRGSQDDVRGRSREELDADLHARGRLFAQQMGISPELVDLADNTPYEDLRILSRDELIRFGMERAQR